MGVGTYIQGSENQSGGVQAKKENRGPRHGLRGNRAEKWTPVEMGGSTSVLSEEQMEDLLRG